MNINFVQNFIFWLQQRRAINLLFVFAYFLFILFMHNPLVRVSVWVEGILSLPVYNIVIAVVFLALISITVFLLQKKLREETQDRKLKLIYLFLTITAIIVHSRFMFDSNIEIVHSLEYTFLAFLIFPFTRRFSAAILFTLPFMLFDEWFQYIVLYPFLDYFDLNDIMMDTYGCGLALTVLMILGVKGASNVQPLWKRPEFITLISLVLLVLVAVKLCFIAPYANEACSNTLLVMNKRIVPEPFYRFHPTHNLWYHVMKPAEAFILIPLLHLFYMGLDSLRKNPA